MKAINLTYLVDDDPIILLLTKRVLSKHQAFGNFMTFANGQLALDHINEQIAEDGELPDMILLDLNMPVMDGWDFLDSCKPIAEVQTIPVFILSSSIDPADIAKCKDYSNVKAFFSKPLTNSNLEQVVRHFAV